MGETMFARLPVPAAEPKVVAFGAILTSLLDTKTTNGGCMLCQEAKVSENWSKIGSESGQPGSRRRTGNRAT